MTEESHDLVGKVVDALVKLTRGDLIQWEEKPSPDRYCSSRNGVIFCVFSLSFSPRLEVTLLTGERIEIRDKKIHLLLPHIKGQLDILRKGEEFERGLKKTLAVLGVNVEVEKEVEDNEGLGPVSPVSPDGSVGCP